MLSEGIVLPTRLQFSTTDPLSPSNGSHDIGNRRTIALENALRHVPQHRPQPLVTHE